MVSARMSLLSSDNTTVPTKPGHSRICDLTLSKVTIASSRVLRSYPRDRGPPAGSSILTLNKRVPPFESSNIEVGQEKSKAGSRRVCHFVRRAARVARVWRVVETHHAGLDGGFVLDDFNHSALPASVGSLITCSTKISGTGANVST